MLPEKYPKTDLAAEFDTQDSVRVHASSAGDGESLEAEVRRTMGHDSSFAWY